MIKRKISIPAVLAALIVLCASVAPADEKSDQIDKIFAEWDSTHSTGMALAVVRDGEIIYKRSYGMANLEQGLPIRTDTVFYVGSVSKQFTAFCTAILVVEGKISLEASIRDYLPELPECFAPVQVQQLVYHTSGIRDFYELLAMSGVRTADDYYNHADILALLRRQRTLNFPPGEKELYSNSGYFLLAELVARVSGKMVNEFAWERIFGPLGMDSTIFHQDHAMLVPRRADGYAPDGDGGFKRFMGHMNIVGAGGVFSTVEDLYRWDQALYGGYFDQQVLDLIHRKGKLNNGDELDYAFGLTVSKYRGLDTVMHGGALFGFTAGYVQFPEQRFSVICLANLSVINPLNLALDVAEIYLGDQMESEPAPTAANATEEKPEFTELPEAELAKFTGTYSYKSGEVLMTILLREGQLVFDRKGWAVIRLAPVAPNHFVAVNTPFRFDLTFEMGDNDLPVKAVSQIRNGQTYEYEALNEQPPRLEPLAGEYYSEELDTTYRLEFVDGALFLRFRNAPDGPLPHRTGDEFFFPGKGINLTFLRGDSGEINALRVDSGRAYNIIFEKK